MNCGNTGDREIENRIQERLDTIERETGVKILSAVESGSRAWGFASKDSDYDVRFVYIRQAKDYLSLMEQKDFIDWELNETLDINGWDLKKFLQHVHKSNATMFEWQNSPIVYRALPVWEQVREVSLKYFSCKASMYHYYATARKNYCEYLTKEQVSYKKYFYVLRPLLSCRWIEEKKSPPPMLFDELSRQMLEKEQREDVERLLKEKRRLTEGHKGDRIDSLNQYIEQSLEKYRQKLETMKDDRNAGWEELDGLFLKCLGDC